MKKLLRFEFYKLWRQKSMRVCSIILICLSVLSLFMAKSVWNNGGADVLSIPTAISLTISALSSCSFSLILAIFTALFISEDNSEGIIKNIYSKGYDRIKVFLSKIIVVSTYCIVMAIICYGIAFFGGMIMFSTEKTAPFSELTVVPIQLLLMLAYTCLYGLIASTTKKSGGAIAGCIVVPILITLVIGLIDTSLHLESFTFGAYWLENMFSSVNIQNASSKSLLIGGFGGIIYAVVFVLLGIFISKKNEC